MLPSATRIFDTRDPRPYTYAPFVVYDLDQDGYAEVYAKAGEGDPRAIDGRVLEGPEYLVKIDGRTGQIEMKRDWHSREGWHNYNRSLRIVRT